MVMTDHTAVDSKFVEDAAAFLAACGVLASSVSVGCAKVHYHGSDVADAAEDARKAVAAPDAAVRAQMDRTAQKFPAGVAWQVRYDPTRFVAESISEVVTTTNDVGGAYNKYNGVDVTGLIIYFSVAYLVLRGTLL